MGQNVKKMHGNQIASGQYMRLDFNSIIINVYFRDSARKTQTMVAFRDGERQFANEAASSVSYLFL